MPPRKTVRLLSAEERAIAATVFLAPQAGIVEESFGPGNGERS
jgi:hypothetical protein